MSGTLYFGDNLDVLREHIKDETVDLIYLDPPFNSAASYNVLFKAPDGKNSTSQIRAFEDTWSWNDVSERAFDDVMRCGRSEVATVLRALRQFLGENDMMAYLAMMTVRLIELHRVLKQTGSVYLHCDPTASHYLKIILDAVFGSRMFRSEIVWQRSCAHNDAKQGRRNYGHTHDIILFYTKSEKYKWNTQYTPFNQEYIDRDYKLMDEGGRRYRRGDLTAAKPGGDVSYDWRVKKNSGVQERWIADCDAEYLNPQKGMEYKAVRPYAGRYWAYSKSNMTAFAREGRLRHTFDGMPEYKRFLDEMPGVSLQDFWSDVPALTAGCEERIGYPTQKPVALLERIVSASSDEGDIILDPFCGCGTAVHAGHKLGRNWLGIDVTPLAVNLIARRLRDAFPGISYDVRGIPKDMDGAHELAARDKHLFQLWATDLIGAHPYRDGKKGADGGIDGMIYFKPDGRVTKAVIVSVKAGANREVAHIRDLRGTIERLQEPMGVFVTLHPPTEPMRREAAAAGLYDTGTHKVARIQIVTIEDALKLRERSVQIPFGYATSFKQAPREKTPVSKKPIDLFGEAPKRAPARKKLPALPMPEPAVAAIALHEMIGDGEATPQ